MRRMPKQNNAQGVDRLTRVNELLKREIADWIEASGLIDRVSLISVTRVECASNLKNATVYISIFDGSPEKEQLVLKELNRLKSELQQTMSRHVILKYTPVLRFVPDHAVEAGDRVLARIRELEEEESHENG